MCLVLRNRILSKAPWLLTISLGFASFVVSRLFSPSHLSPWTAQIWSAVENNHLPVTAPISSYISLIKLLYLFSIDVMVFCSPRPDLFNINVLRSPMLGGRVFSFPKKIRYKKVFLYTFFQSRERFSHIFYHALQKDPLWLDRKFRRSVTLLSIFLRCFSENKNVTLPFLCLLFDPIAFEIFNPKITCAHAHLKLMTLEK